MAKLKIAKLKTGMGGLRHWHVFAALAALFAAVSLWFAYDYWGDILFAVKGGSWPNALAAYAQPFFWANLFVAYAQPFFWTVIFWRLAHRFHKDFPNRGVGVWETALLAVSALVVAAPYIQDELRWKLFLQPPWALAIFVMTALVIYAAAGAINELLKRRRKR